MTEIEEHYNIENGAILIEMRLRKVMQIFNSLDPSPFHEKDLDPDAEAYISEIVQDFPLAQPMKIVIHLPCEEPECEEGKTLEPAIQNHYSYLEASAQRELRLKFRQGRVSLLIGIAFLFFMAGVFYLIQSHNLFQGPTSFLTQGLVVVSWVAMWEPITIFLYGWWPIRRKRLIYEKISRMAVEVRHDGSEGEAGGAQPPVVPREES